MVDIGGAISGAVSGALGGGSSGGGSSIEDTIAQLQETFDKATENTAKITKVTTEGNVKKDAAAQRPR